MAADLCAEGYDIDKVASQIGIMQIRPDRNKRFFIAHLHNGVIRTVMQGIMIETKEPGRAAKIARAIKEKVVATKLSAESVI